MTSGVELATAWVRLVPSAEGSQDALTKELGPAAEAAGDDAGKKAGSKFTTGMKAAVTVGAAAIAGAVVAIFQTGMEELKFGEEINAQTDTLVKNTGFTMKTDEINDFTLALSKVSGSSEEDLQAAGNNILKFGDVSEDTYKRSVDAINNLGGAGKDVIGSSEALGKALADPAKAAGLLKKQGIMLTEQQIAMIDTMTEAGDKAGAQGVILDALEGTYGGMAEAAGGTLTGGINKMTNSWENVAGMMVETAMPAILAITDVLMTVMTWMESNPAIVQALAVVIGILTIAIIAATVAMWALSLTPVVLIIMAIIVAVALLIAGIVLLVMNWDAVMAWIGQVLQGFCDWIVGIFEGIAKWWNDLWAEIGRFFTELWTNVVNFFTGIWEGIVNWFTALLISIMLFILSTLHNINNFWTSVWTGIVSFFTGLWNGLVSFISGVFTNVSNIINGALDWIGGVWRGAWQGIVDFFGNVFGGLVGIAKGPINGVISLINGAIRALNGFKVTIPDWVPGIGGGTFGLSIPTIPMLAKGGTLTQSGHVIVGENGPELLKLPKGAQVNPNYDDLPDGKGVTFNNYAPLGSTPSQELETFANRAEVFLP